MANVTTDRVIPREGEYIYIYIDRCCLYQILSFRYMSPKVLNYAFHFSKVLTCFRSVLDADRMAILKL